MKGCKIYKAYAHHLGHLSTEGSLSRQTCCDMEPWFFLVSLKALYHSVATSGTEDLFSPRYF